MSFTDKIQNFRWNVTSSLGSDGTSRYKLSSAPTSCAMSETPPSRSSQCMTRLWLNLVAAVQKQKGHGLLRLSVVKKLSSTFLLRNLGSKKRPFPVFPAISYMEQAQEYYSLFHRTIIIALSNLGWFLSNSESESYSDSQR
mmetsp:Transcript_28386/g.51426  ORF Transcript_28386/g.51426 Transcript_28386/m.51426 type:complete len:141 (+) Transcript_28386:1002-1424(+)